MIQTKIPVVYGNRSEKLGIVKVEVRPLQNGSESNTYNVIDFEVIDGIENAIFSKEVTRTDGEIDQLDAYIEDNYPNELQGLGHEAKELKKLQLALMIDTQTNLLPSGKTIYGLNPEDWELC